MPFVRCPNCDEKVKVARDEDRPAIRCPTCRAKIRLDEPDDTEDGPVRRSTQRQRPAGKVPATLPLSGIELVSLGLALVVGLVLISASFFHQGMAGLGVLAALVICLAAFIRASSVVSWEGTYISFDYLDFLGGWRWVLAIGFFGFYLMGYMLLWFSAQVRHVFVQPKKVGPWLGLQLFGVLVGIFSLIGGSVSNRAAMQEGRQAQEAKQAAARKNAAQGQDNDPPPNKRPAEWPRAKPDHGLPQPNRPVDGPQTRPAQDVPPSAVTGDAQLDRLLADLPSKKAFVAQKAAKQLAALPPNEHRPAVAVKLAEQVQQHQDSFNKCALANALCVWATAKEVPVLIALLGDKDINTRNEVLKGIGKLRDERSVASVARCLLDLATSYHAERALKEMGPLAEIEVLGVLNQKGGPGRQAAIRVLRDIGTQQSIPALQAASQDFVLQGAARGAMDAINARTKP